MIDEAPRLAGRLDIEELTSIARSAGISVTIVAQDVAQFRDADERSTILTNCATIVTCRGVSKATSDYLQGRLGERMEAHTSTSDEPRSFSSGRRISHSFEATPILRHREIAQPPFGDHCALVQSNAFGVKPVLVDLELEG
jgi:type IV secretory pathway TraG/TraD family ATPase VirD4